MCVAGWIEGTIPLGVVPIWNPRLKKKNLTFSIFSTSNLKIFNYKIERWYFLLNNEELVTFDANVHCDHNFVRLSIFSIFMNICYLYLLHKTECKCTCIMYVLAIQCLLPTYGYNFIEVTNGTFTYKCVYGNLWMATTYQRKLVTTNIWRGNNILNKNS